MTDKVYGLWFRRDLRLDDHAALYYLLEDAKADQATWFAFFHINPEFNDPFDLRYDYYFRTLEAFLKICEQEGVPVHLVTGSVTDAMEKLVREVKGLERVYFNKDEVGYGVKRDAVAVQCLEKFGVTCLSYTDAHLHGAEEVRKKDGTSYQVFTPYYHAWQTLDKPAVLQISQDGMSASYLKRHPIDPEGTMTLEKILDKATVNWKGLGHESAHERMASFLENHLYRYDRLRDLPAVDGTSRLSPYLKTGVLSIRTLYHRVMDQEDSKGRQTFIQELAWRDFYNIIYTENPSQKHEEIREAYRGISWENDYDRFQAWCEGRTGFPIIDAAMRQLNKWGWMHNRLRMITASFLTKDYLIDWRKGEAYFSRNLIDYDPASNIGGWQWAASVGTDAVPYFRVFNPVTQSKRFDPDGTFIKTFVPELSKVDTKYIHEPWKMSEDEQKKVNCIIGEDYPMKRIDHKEQRQKAIAMFEAMKDREPLE